MQWEVEDLNERARKVLLGVVKTLSSHFPIFGQALHAKLAGTRLTNERWSEILCVLLAARSLPGALLNDDERESRSTALRVIALAERMRAATSGVGKHPDYLAWAADLHIREFEEVGPSAPRVNHGSIEKTVQEK